MNLTNDTSLALMQATQGDASAKADKAKNAAALKQEAALDRAAQEFEAMFMAQMLKPMFEGLEVDKTFGGGKGEEIFRGFMIQEYGKIIAETGQLGIADAVKEELIRMQGSVN
ncbi:MAG: rod-binding protein [Pseudomonadota bacterium]